MIPVMTEEIVSDVESGGEADMESGNESYSEEESSEQPKNLSWANAMSKVLKTTPKNKSFILSKAKKDSDLRKNKPELEIVDLKGKSIKGSDEKEKQKTGKELRKDFLEKQKKKVEWEGMCRVKPDKIKKEKERELVRIATRGVVHLFNTVEKHQNTMPSDKKRKTSKKEKVNIAKGNFMDILNDYSKKDSSLKKKSTPSDKTKEEATWSILKDDFMMGAEMKDWDKKDEDT